MDLEFPSIIQDDEVGCVVVEQGLVPEPGYPRGGDTGGRTVESDGSPLDHLRRRDLTGTINLRWNYKQ